MKWRQARITTKWSSPTHLAHFLSPSLLFDQQTIPHCEFVNCETVKICSPFLFATDKKLVYTLPCSIIGSENLIWHSVFQSENRERKWSFSASNKQSAKSQASYCRLPFSFTPFSSCLRSAQCHVYHLHHVIRRIALKLFVFCALHPTVSQTAAQPSM